MYKNKINLNWKKECSLCGFLLYSWFKMVLKLSEDFGSVRKSSGNWPARFKLFGNIRSNLKVSDPSKLLRASNDGKVEWHTTRCILLVENYRTFNGFAGFWLTVICLAWDKYSCYIHKSLDNGYFTTRISAHILCVSWCREILDGGDWGLPPWEYSHILTIRVCAALQDMVFKPFCQEQGIENTMF